MSHPYEGITPEEVGASLLAWVAATRAGRWRGPRGALDYVAVEEGTPDALVRDFVAWASGYSEHLAPGARARMESVGDALARRAVDGMEDVR